MNRIATWAAVAALAVSPIALAQPSTAAPARVGKTYSVTAKINETIAVSKETTLKVRGRVTPRAAGEKVVLQQRVGNKTTWKVTGTSKVKANGTYVLKDDPSTPGKREYRVVKPASDGIAKGVSKSLEVQVYAWENLAYRTAGGRFNVISKETTIGTDYYPASLVTDWSGTASVVEYTLGRKCLALRATYALSDESASGSSAWITVSADGAVLASHSLTVGTVLADQVYDVSDAYRIRFDMDTSRTPAGVAAIGTPQVLCTR